MKKILLNMFFGLAISSLVCCQQTEWEKSLALENKYKKIYPTAPGSTLSIFFGGYEYKWQNEVIHNKKLQLLISKELNHSKYQVIWKGDLNNDSQFDYFAVIPSGDIYHGITKGVLLSSSGKVFLRINKYGVTSNGKYLYEFKKMNIRISDIKCIRPVFTYDNLHFSESKYRTNLKDIPKGKGISIGYGFYFQIIDKDNCNIGPSIYLDDVSKQFSCFSILKNNFVSHKGVLVDFLIYMPYGYNAHLKNQRLFVNKYYSNKKMGKCIKVFNKKL